MRISRPFWMCGAMALVWAGPGHATPSTVFWAPSTPYLQPFGKLHVTYDTYFDGAAAYPTDTGLTIGALPWQSLQLEVGFDLAYPTYSAGEPLDVPILVNAKLGAPEGAYFAGSPGWSAGAYGVGFEEDVTDYNILHATIGKTFGIGSLAAGVYHGANADLFHSSSGSEEQTGFLASWTSPAIDVPSLDKLLVVWDVLTGENVLGATGGGLYVYFTADVDLLMGPVFFFDPDLQPGGSSWMWSMQLDADIDLTP